MVVALQGRPAQQGTTFKSRTAAVRVDVLVTDGERVVSGLTAADFVVFDNKVKQSPALVTVERLALTVVVALDVSSSLSAQQLEHLKDAARAIVSSLQPGDRARVLSFGDKIVLSASMEAGLQNPNNDHLLGTLSGGGGTPLFDATYAALTTSETGDGSRALAIVFSDGDDTSSILSADDVIGTTKRTAAVVYAVRTKSSARFLAQVSEETGGRVFGMKDTRDLGALVKRVLGEFRDRYVLSYTPQGVSEDGWHEVRVQVPGRRVTVQARRGYFHGR